MVTLRSVLHSDLDFKLFSAMGTRCAGDMRYTYVDIGETIAQRRRRTGTFKSTGPPPERRCTISSTMPNTSYQVTRMRNLSGGSSGSTASGSSSGSSTQLDNQFSSDNHMYFSLDISSFANPSPSAGQSRGESSSPSSHHRKLDRSLSDSDNSGNNSSHRSVNSSRYKTELCRPFEESGSCKYGDKCQFAHGAHELRNLARHPKYKTELCRTFHTIGFCPYGPRCHFIHEDDKGDSKHATSGTTSPTLSPTGSDQDKFSYSDSSNMNMDKAHQVNNSLSVNINNYGNVDLQSLEQQFGSALNLNRSSESSRNMYSSTGKSDEYDIFSCISVFNPDDVDNEPKPSNSIVLSKQPLDNYPTFVDTSCFWPSSISSQSVAPVDPYHYSPTGSTGSTSSSASDSSGSDCSGSTESLASSGYRDWHPHMPYDLVY